MSHEESTSTKCLNCGATLRGPFCAHCGQRVATARPTLHHFFHEATHEFLHVDGKIWRSLWLLFRRPGFLTREYFAGRRARYIGPIRLYLLFSVLFFAVSAMLPQPVVVTVDDRVEMQREAAGSVTGRTVETPEEVASRATAARQKWGPRAMFVLVPLAALLVMGFTRRAHRTYIEHLYFTLHTHAALFAALTLAWLAERAFDGARDTVRTATLFVVAAYFWPALREAYGGGVILNTGRTLALSLLYLITLLAAVAAIVTLAVVLPS